MSSTVIKVDRDRDLYLVWESETERFIVLGDRAYVAAALYEYDDRKLERIPAGQRPEDRIARADEAGSSALWPSTREPAFGWQDEGWIYRQQGVLPRARLEELCERIQVADDFDVDVRDLLLPFEDGHRG